MTAEAAAITRQVLIQLDRTIHLPGMSAPAIKALKAHRDDVQAELHNPDHAAQKAEHA